MRKSVIALMVVGILTVATMSYAHMWGGGGPGWGRGSGPGMMQGTDEKSLEETYELRKSLHEKRFEYKEAWIKGDEKTLETLDKEIAVLEEELDKKLGGKSSRYGRGYKRGKRFGRGGGGGGGYGGGPGGCGNCDYGPGGWR